MQEDPLQIARKQIEFARQYTCELLEGVADDEWFRMPEGAVSHLAWQMGHLAMAEYGLVLLRVRGKEPSDAEFITNDFLRTFKKGSTPVADPTAYPSPAEIRQTFDAVHAHALDEMAGFDLDQLADPVPMPTAVYETKLGSLFFCPMHEMIHAGQIGNLRRMLGKDPLR